MKYTIYNGLLMLVISSVIAGCSSMTSTSLGKENVAITKGPISRNCTLKGKVAVSNAPSNMSSPYQHTQLLEDEYNQLRTQAWQMGANTVVLSASSGMTDMKHWASKNQHREEAAHIYSGNAYWCPSH